MLWMMTCWLLMTGAALGGEPAQSALALPQESSEVLEPTAAESGEALSHGAQRRQARRDKKVARYMQRKGIEELNPEATLEVQLRRAVRQRNGGRALTTGGVVVTAGGSTVFLGGVALFNSLCTTGPVACLLGVVLGGTVAIAGAAIAIPGAAMTAGGITLIGVGKQHLVDLEQDPGLRMREIEQVL